MICITKNDAYTEILSMTSRFRVIKGPIGTKRLLKISFKTFENMFKIIETKLFI